MSDAILCFCLLFVIPVICDFPFIASEFISQLSPKNLAPVQFSLAKPTTLVFVFGCVYAGVVLVALQVVPVLEQFIGVKLVGGNQVTVLAAAVRHAPVVKEKLIWRGLGINPQLGQTDTHIHVL